MKKTTIRGASAPPRGNKIDESLDYETSLNLHDNSTSALKNLSIEKVPDLILSRHADIIIKWHQYVQNQEDSGGMFSDPALYILLFLFSSQCQARYVSVKEVCLMSGVPHSTAIRWIDMLESKRFVERLADGVDGRRIFVLITNQGMRLARDVAHFSWTQMRQSFLPA